MNEEMINLGRRAVACPRWRWMPGMRGDHNGERFTFLWDPPGDINPACVAWVRVGPMLGSLDLRDPDVLPDLSDPATLGCLLALVRECLHDEVTTFTTDELWLVGLYSYGAWDLATEEGCDTEAAALVAALEAAP